MAVLSKEAFETMPEEEAIKIGTGPWMYEEFVAGDYVSLVPFEGSTLYPVPTADRLVFKMIPEAAARMIALENGEVDMIMSPDATDYERLRTTEGLQLLEETGRTQHFICFNQKSPNEFITNPEFRKAVAYAIDKDEMILAAWDGNAIKSTSVQCRDVEFYVDLEGIPYDAAKAQAMFEELGAVGQTFKLVTSDAAHRVKIAENFQAQMAEYGITIECEFMQQAALMELCTSDGTTSGTEIIVMSWTPGKNGDYMYRNTTHSTGGRNYAQFNDPELDALIDKAAGCEDKVERAALYKELQEKLTYDVVGWIPIAQHQIYVGSNDRIEGVLLHPALVHSFKYVNVVE
jgi:peptide/nickel transport system substrate-binding protein